LSGKRKAPSFPGDPGVLTSSVSQMTTMCRLGTATCETGPLGFMHTGCTQLIQVCNFKQQVALMAKPVVVASVLLSTV
jgi:hypothetical protein